MVERVRILLVEDDVTGRETLAELLEAEGPYQVTRVEDGAAGIELLENREQFDVVITDIKMRRADGVQVLRAARRHSPDTAVILVTGYGSLETATAAVKEGAFAYLLKPLDFDKLARAVSEASGKVRLIRENKELVQRLSRTNAELQARVVDLERANERVCVAQRALAEHEKLRALGQLVSGIAHELRNPLAGMLGLSESLLDEPKLDEESRADIDEIRKLSLRCKDIVDNLLRFARRETLEKKPAPPMELIDQALGLLAHQLRNDGVHLSKNIAADLPPVMVNQSQILQVFFNILQNALQAMEGMPSGTKHLYVQAEREGAMVAVTISDTGPGIAALDRLFEPFYTTKPVGQGTGLGLALSLGIVEEHGGSISAENVPGTGARFKVRLPMATHLALAPSPLPEEKPVPVVPSLRVMLIDDEEIIVKVLHRSLARRGLHVETFASADAAQKRLADENAPPFDLVLTDLRMPGDIGGYELIKWIGANKQELLRHLIVMTGDQLQAANRALKDVPDLLILTKPFEIEDLLRHMRDKSARPFELLDEPEEEGANGQ